MRTVLLGFAGCLFFDGWRRWRRSAQQTQSRLFDITKAGTLRVCVWPLYYSIAMRDTKTGELVGIDADLSKELAKDMGVKLAIRGDGVRDVHCGPAGE